MRIHTADGTASDMVTKAMTQRTLPAEWPRNSTWTATMWPTPLSRPLTDIRAEAMEEKLQAAIDSGRITEEEAEEIREQFNSGDGNGFGKRGRHGASRRQGPPGPRSWAPREWGFRR